MRRVGSQTALRKLPIPRPDSRDYVQRFRYNYKRVTASGNITRSFVLPIIAIPAVDRNDHHTALCARAVESAGGQPRIIAPTDTAAALDGAGGLLLPDGCGDGLPSGLLEAALAADRPVLLTGSGMHLLNAAFGGQPATATGNHNHEGRHQIYLSPGSKVAAIIGGAGMYRVNSRHGLGLREAQRAPRLMSVAYQLDDGVIEGLESKEHGWVIGVQFLPERRDEVSAAFNSLFLGLVERAAAALRPDSGFS